MTAEIVQIRDYQSKRNLARAEKELERQAMEIANIAFPFVYDGSGIDGMQFNTAPEKDGA
jgi:hypothetical protein